MELSHRFSFLFAVIFCAMAVGTARLHADSTPPAIETVEMLMDAVAAEGQFLGRQFGADPDNELQFTANFDPTAKTFDYAFVGGTTYTGEPLLLSGSGSFDAENNQWTGDASGQRGTETLAWTSSWNYAEEYFTWETIVDGTKLDFHRHSLYCWSDSLSKGWSTHEMESTRNDIVIASGHAHDLIDWWNFSYFTLDSTLPEAFVSVNGDHDGVGAATGAMIVPEPCGAILLVLGALSIRRRRHRYSS